MQRDEETVRADEESARSEDLQAQLEGAKARVGELMATNEKNATLLQIEANRRLLEIKLMTPSKLLMRETPVKATPIKPRMSDFGAVTTPSVGGGLGSAFKAVNAGKSMTPVPETPAPDPQAPPQEDFEESSRKWQKAAGSLQAALDSAVVSRDAYAAAAESERQEKDRVLKMYEKEKQTVRHELNQAFQQAKANQKRMNETTMIANESNDALKQDLAASRKQVKKLTAGLEEVGEKFKGVIKAKHEKDAELLGLQRERQLLKMKLKDVVSERDFLKESLAALKEARILDEEGFEVERARFERELVEARENVEVKEVVVEKIVEVEAEGEAEGERAQGEAALVQALKEELRDRDVEVQKLRKKVKGIERELDARGERGYNDENAAGGGGAAAWTKLKPSARTGGRGDGENNPWEAARSRGRGGGFVVDTTLDNIQRAERLERAFGQISMKLQSQR